jgi:uncharacterized membrane protein
LEQLNPSDTPDMPWGLVFGLFITVDLLGVCIGAIFLRMWGSTRATGILQMSFFFRDGTVTLLGIIQENSM